MASSAARTLGLQAVALTLGARRVTLVHAGATRALAGAPRGIALRAARFLSVVLRPMELAERALMRANGVLAGRNAALRAHAIALHRSNRRFEREIGRRMIAEAAIRQGQEKYRVLLGESHAMQRQLRHLTRQIIHAQEEERKEISRELHDEVVQTLVGINVELAALGKGASTGFEALQVKIARTQKLVINSVNAVHRFARELRPAVLDDLGLIPALHSFSQNLAARKKLKIDLTAFEGVELLESGKRTVLFRVAQEALTNVARHADASRVTVHVSEVGHRVRMDIGDNGKSFLVEKTLRARNANRLGLIGMKERIEMVGGTLVIESTPGHGTLVRAEIPFGEKRGAR